MSLHEWERNGWLRRHQPNPAEIADLFTVARRDLHDCQQQGLSDDWRFAIAYNAALQMARAALLSSGYDVPKAQMVHFRAIQSLAYSIGLSADLVAQLDEFWTVDLSNV